jgi:eukaryotic-like serine/threonine-protein kinase
MAPQDADALGALLDQAASLPPEARAAFLDRACGNDRELRAELTSLVAAHDAASGYFDGITEQIIRPAVVALGDDVGDEFSLGQTIAQYRIVERLGGGGMGVVFKVLDLRLDRFVALKFLAAHLSADPVAKARLVAEAKAASALDHPNIGIVHDIGETSDRRLFIVMGYYEGETLERMNARGAVSVRQAIHLVKQVANALSAAHQKRIIHRDVKPSNILVTKGGTAKLLDFGIAKLVDSTPTKEGATPGTVAYMSPEQTLGGAIDHRTDLWSLGVVLYQLVAGVRPFQGENEEALVSAIRHGEWQRPLLPTGELGEGVRRILECCLAKDPCSRYAGAEELLADLRALDATEYVELTRISDRRDRSRLARYSGVAALMVVFGILGIYIGRWADDNARPQHSAAAQSHRSRLAVLPLVSVSSDEEETYLADGMTEELIAQLSKIDGLRVIARSSIMPFKGSGKRAHDIAGELAAGSVLEGSLRKTDGQLKITLQLVDARSQEQVWTRNYTAAIGDFQGVQRDIVLQVAEALRMQVQSPEHRLSQMGTTSADAYVLYLKGRHFLEKRNVDAAKEAKDYFEQALDLDPAFAKAWVGLGDTFSVLAALAAVRTADGYSRSKAAAERALQIDPDLAEAHVCLATALASYYWDFETAGHHYRRAIELNPSYAAAHRLYAEHLRFEARFDEALREARQAEELDPLSSAPQIVAGTILYWARRYDEAIAEFRRILDVNPRFAYAYFFLALAEIQKHDYDKAAEALSVPGAGSTLQQEVLRGYIDAVSGRHAAARDILERLSREQNLSPWHFAIIHIGLGEHDRAIDLLEQAYQARDWQVRMLPVEPLLDPLRSHPRFRVLADKVRGNSRG